MKKVMMLLGVLFLLAAPGMAQNKQSIGKALVNSISPFGTTKNSLSIAKTVERSVLQQTLSHTNVTGKELAWEDVKAAILSGDRDKIIEKIIPNFATLAPEEKNKVRAQVVAIAKMRDLNPGSEAWNEALKDFGGELPKLCSSIYSVAVIPARDHFRLSVCCTGTIVKTKYRLRWNPGKNLYEEMSIDTPYGWQFEFGDWYNEINKTSEEFSDVREARDMMLRCTLDARDRGGYFLDVEDFGWHDAYKLKSQLIDKRLESSGWLFIRLIGHTRHFLQPLN